MLFIKVLLYCFISFSAARPSDVDNLEETSRDSKGDKFFQHETTGEWPNTDSPTTIQALAKLKSIARLQMANHKEAEKSLTLSREEMEALRDLLNDNLQKYQNFHTHSQIRRPNDPYIGQILNNLNSLKNRQDFVQNDEPHNIPVRRKIIKHTVFMTPNLGYGYQTNQVTPSFNQYAQNSQTGQSSDQNSRIWSPWAEYFPILIRDPLQGFTNYFSETIEYGPDADICKKDSSTTEVNSVSKRHQNNDAIENNNENLVRKRDYSNQFPNDRSQDHSIRFPEDDSRQSRTMEKTIEPTAKSLKRSRRNVDEEKGVLNNIKPFRPQTTTTVAADKLQKTWIPYNPNEHNGDTGPQIKRLVVRKGGVAIAGPGGIATAGSGGTAIVGPGGSAYSSKHSASGSTSENIPAGPGGISMAGYGPNVVSPQFYSYPMYRKSFGRKLKSKKLKHDSATAVLSTDGVAYTFPVRSRGLTVEDSKNSHSASTAREIKLPDGAKIIATGPIVYYNPENPSKKKSRKEKISKTFDDSIEKLYGHIISPQSD
ncbi:uncharacterized protein LOC126907848 isoform X2 [Daktulosphaira vitifoliae]|uniref:uncharacterized protein LOC126907848 isoform X2 n=1 Tax=Daktulosphaira vitifoliae TaxID=58002 RepID=UPI0021AAFCDC|nr:uncharacterized protein LOC126907848 isoform X2 [Daktulosphaira vitifoliae]